MRASTSRSATSPIASAPIRPMVPASPAPSGWSCRAPPNSPCQYCRPGAIPFTDRRLRPRLRRPQLFASEPGARDQCFELGPGELRMDAPAEAAIGAGNDVLAPHDAGKSQDAVGDELGMLDDVGGVADDPRDQDLALGQFDVLPNSPFVRVANIARLDRERAGAHLQ